MPHPLQYVGHGFFKGNKMEITIPIKKKKIIHVCQGYYRPTGNYICKNVKWNGQWEWMENITWTGGASHGLCPSCAKVLEKQMENVR